MSSNEPSIQIYEFADFRLDAAKRLLLKGDHEPLPLTPKVFDTLLYLVRHGGKVIEKDELMREIWTDTVVEENNLSQNISILRRTLGEKPGEGRFIATVPGRGFRFVPEVREIEQEKFDASNKGPHLISGEISQDKLQYLRPEAKTRNKKRVRFALFAVLGVLVLGSVGIYFWLENTNPAASAPVKTLAILPFKPLVADSRDESLEIGMADTLIARLGDDPEIVVRPLSSVRRFGSLEQDALTAGRALDVEAVLDGTLQRSGDSIRVNARLIKVVDGTVMWTGTFDEKFSNIFAVQDAISIRVAAALSMRLGSNEKLRLVKHHTENVEAYQLYLRGRFHVFKLTPPEIQQGISYFQQAITIDTNYALAYIGLASGYRSLVLGTEMPPTEFLTRSRIAAQKAIELDDSLSDGHSSLGMTLFWEWDWDEAEKQHRRALDLNPNNAEAHLFYAHLLSNLGRHAEALAEAKLARELDPLFPFAGALEGQFLNLAGRTDEALARLKKTTELAPSFWMPHLIASICYIDTGMYPEALIEARKAKELSPAQSISATLESYALARSGRHAEARALLNELLELSTTRFVPPVNFAHMYNALGETELSLDWLEKAYEQRDPRMTFLKVDSKWNKLRNEPRFIELMRKMELER